MEILRSRIQTIPERNLWPASCTIGDVDSGQDLLTMPVPPRSSIDWGTTYPIKLTDGVLRIGSEMEFNFFPTSARSNADELMMAARRILFNNSASKSEELRALHFMKEAYRTLPTSIETTSLIVLAHLRTGNARDAVLAMFPNNEIESKFKGLNTAEVHTLRALVHHFNGQRDKALESLQQAQRLASHDETLWRQLIDASNREMAIPSASHEPEKWLGRKLMPRLESKLALLLPLVPRVVNEDRVFVGDHSFRSWELVKLEDAAAYYSSGLELHANSPHWWTYRGLTYKYLGEYDKAIEDFSRAIGLGQDPSYLVNRGNLLLEEKNEYELAIADFRKATERLSSDYRAHASLANAYRLNGELDKAMDAANQAIRANPKLGSNYCKRAYIHAAAGRLDAMNSDFEEAAERSPEDCWVWLQRAWLRATSTDDAHRNAQLAIDDATKACELDQWMDESCLDHLAAAYAEASEFDKAIHWQEKAIEKCPIAKRSKLEARLNLYLQHKAYREPLIRVQPAK